MKKITLYIVLGILFLAAFTTYMEYSHESYVTATVQSVNTQQHTEGDKDGFKTTYKYLVATDRGTFEIKPNGLMYSEQFGTLKEGGVYRFHLRGYSIPLIGLYPYIMSATIQEGSK